MFDIKNALGLTSGNNMNIDDIDMSIRSAKCALLEYAINKDSIFF